MAKIIVNDGEGESEFALTANGATIGRVAKQCDIVIKVPEASREHCRVKFENNAWFVEDLGSSNGTRVNGRKVTTFELQDGDEIVVGKARLRFLESDVEVPEISLDDDDDIELEISLEDECYLRFLNTDRKGDKVAFAGRMTFGRRSSNTVTLNEKGVSGNHTEFVSDGGEWVARDLGSTNGTIINGEPAVEERLSAGDRVRIGTVEFVFGVGEDEGDADLVATVMMADAPLEEEIFAISAANMQRKQKAATVFWLAFVVAVAGGGGWWLMQGERNTSQTRDIVEVVDNQLGLDGTFEPREDEEDYLTTDSDAVDFIETTRRKASGTRALEVKVNSADGDHYVAFTREIKNISTSDRIEIGGAVRASGATGGAAGLSLLWKDSAGRVMSASHVNTPEGESGFAPVKGLFIPPYGAETAAVAIGFHDASGKIIVDDVYALRSRGGGQTMKVHGYDVHLDASGALVIGRDGAEILDHGGLYTMNDKKPVFTGRLFAAATQEGGPEGKTLSGYHSAGDGADAEFSAAKDGNGVVWGGRVGGAADLRLGFRIDLAEGLVTVGADGARRHTEDFTRENVNELVVATGPRAVRMVFEVPQTVQLLSGRRGAIVLLPLAAAGDDKRAFSHRVQLNFDAEMGEVTALSEKARDADIARKSYGEAMSFYQEIVNRFSFRKEESDRAAARLAQLNGAAERALDRLDADVNDVLFFKTFGEERARLVAELDTLITSYKGSDWAARFEEARGRLEGAWSELTLKRRAELAQNHLMRGRDLMEPGQSSPVLARGFFLSVLQLTPEGDLAEEAKSELEKIKSLLGSK